MNTYTLATKELPLNEQYDVIVVGGGPAGAGAAAASGREGNETLLVEATSALGGMGTVGLVPAWTPFSDGKQIIYGGLARSIFEKTREGMPHLNKNHWDWVPIDPELLKRNYDELLADNGVQVLFNTFLAAVDSSQTAVNALILANKSGLTAYRAKVYIDATADADLSVWAGADYCKGDKHTGELMPATLCFTLANVDDYAFAYGPPINQDGPGSWRYEMLRSGNYPLLADGHLCISRQGPGVYGLNAGHLWQVDNTLPQTVSAALIQGRKIALEFKNALAEYHPAFRNAFLVKTGPLLGIRETRRIVGDYVLTFDDYINRRTFDDEICRNNYPIDIHTAQSEVEQAKAGQLHVMERFENYKNGESHGIPYRCLTPKGIRNVLTPGRAISCDRLVQGSIRVMPPCLCMGEGAGVASAMALRAGNDVHAIDTHALRDKLRTYGAYLP